MDILEMIRTWTDKNDYNQNDQNSNQNQNQNGQIDQNGWKLDWLEIIANHTAQIKKPQECNII